MCTSIVIICPRGLQVVSFIMFSSDSCHFSILSWVVIRQNRDECLVSVLQVALSLEQIYIILDE